jgi:hypothetical protein
MLKPTLITWALVIFGAIVVIPLFSAQLLMLLQPRGGKVKELLIGKGEEWRDNSHFRASYGLAWADWILGMPLMVSGSIGVLSGRPWGYVLWAAAGTISLYSNIFLWFFEREYVYPSQGPLVYYTYYWGFFVYWGAAVIAYSVLRLVGVMF